MDERNERLAKALRIEKEVSEPSFDFMIECVEAVMRQHAPSDSAEMMGEQRVKGETERLRERVAELEAANKRK